MTFHWRFGKNITISNDNIAQRKNTINNEGGLVFGAEPLTDDQMFEIKINIKTDNPWAVDALIGIGVTAQDPAYLPEIPRRARLLRNHAWGTLQDDTLGIMRTKAGELHFFRNRILIGVGPCQIPPRVFPLVELTSRWLMISFVSQTKVRYTMDEIRNIIENANMNPLERRLYLQVLHNENLRVEALSLEDQPCKCCEFK